MSKKSKENCLKWKKNNPKKVRESQRKWVRKNPEKVRAIEKKYKGKNPEKVKEWDKKYRVNNPEKIMARRISNNKVPLKNECEDCGTSEKLEHHHPDYSKPLLTTTLCKPCHANIHKGVK